MDSINSPVRLENGVEMPCVGFGTFQTPADVTASVVREALEAGYTHIDTAAIYGNEEGVGQAIKDSGIDRGDLFITTKMWNTERGYDSALTAFDTSMEKLGLEYLDLYLLHWPANYLQHGDAAKQLNAESWRALEYLYETGRVRSIGVSNFLVHHLEELAKTAKIQPMVNQIEFHPGWYQRGIVKYCQEKGIVVQAWSPLGQKDALDNPVLVDIAKELSVSTAQVCLRWVLQRGGVPLPKTVSRDRMETNADIFGFELSDEQLKAIDALENIGGQCARPDDVLF